MDKKLYFQTTTSKVNSEDQKVPNINNFRDFVFEITPKLKNEFNKTHSELKKEYKRLVQDYKNMNNQAEGPN